MEHYDIVIKYIRRKKIFTYSEASKGNNIINVITSAITRLEERQIVSIEVISINIKQLA